VPEDLKQKKYEELNSYEMSQLDDLKRFIWDRRLKARKAKARGETKAAASETAKEDLEVKADQPSFF
jgi:hypothetical protein